jgi:hypothetical protein
MIIRILFLYFALCQTIFAGALFNVTASGQPAQVSVTVCLNGKGPISCQTYNVAALNLSITTTIPGHNYPDAGIKINTPGYQPTNCTLNSNGYCLFSVSSTQPVSIPVTPTTCQSQTGVVSFTPANTTVNNPTGGSPNPSQTFTISMVMCNSLGQALTPSETNPIHVNVYGAPNGVISPTATTTSTGSVTFTYSGDSFPNNISINAWISDSTNNGAALGVTQVLKQNTPTCSYGSLGYNVDLTQTLPNALQVQADVGHDLNASTATLTSFTIDTGSLGVVVPRSELPHNANVIGPGAPGVKYYDSSGNTFSGHYYIAPVRLQHVGGVVETQPILVLAIDKAYCTGPTTKACYSNPPAPDLHYLGVGFNRNGTIAGDLFDSPASNAFLHITNINNGTDLSPGYLLTPGDSMTPHALKLGITDSTGFNVVNLTPNAAVPGDFNAQPGCFSFPGSPSPNQFCGTALLDVGIDYMFLDLPNNQRPAGTFDANNNVPAGTSMSILMGPTSTPAMSYPFTAVLSNPPANTPTPAKVEWINSASIFVNTGRRPLYSFNYFYDGQCGQVGFKALP